MSSFDSRNAMASSGRWQRREIGLSWRWSPEVSPEVNVKIIYPCRLLQTKLKRFRTFPNCRRVTNVLCLLSRTCSVCFFILSLQAHQCVTSSWDEIRLCSPVRVFRSTTRSRWACHKMNRACNEFLSFRQVVFPASASNAESENKHQMVLCTSTHVVL